MKKAVFIIFATLCCDLFSIGLEAQNQRLDSLKQAYQVATSDTSKVILLNDIALQYRYISEDTTLFFARKAHLLAKEKDLTKGLAFSYYCLGVGYHLKGNFDSATYFYEQSEVLAKEVNDLRRLSAVLNNVGLIFWNKGEYPKALDRFQQSLVIDEQLGNLKDQAAALNNIGLIYNNIGDHELALEHFQRSMDIWRQFDNKFSLAQLLNNIGLIQTKLKLFDKALQNYRKSIVYSLESDAYCHQAYPLVGISRVMYATNQLDSVVYYSERTLELLESCSEIKIMATAYNLLGKAQRKKGRIAEANATLVKAFRLSTQLGAREDIGTAAKELHLLHKEKGDFRKALYYSEIQMAMQDSIRSEDKIMALARLEARHQAEKEKQQLLADQEKEKLIFESKIKKEKASKYYLAGGLIGLLIFGMIYFRLYRVNKKGVLLLAEKNHTIRQINKSLIKLNNFKEGLTHMIAHDMKNALNAVVNLSQGRPDKQKMNSIARSGYLALNLVINMLDVQKFEETKIKPIKKRHQLNDLLRDAIEQVGVLLKIKNIQVSHNAEERTMVRLDSDLITRVLVNLLTNAIKYSPVNSAVKIDVQCVASSSHRLHIAVTDQGPGISPESIDHVFEKYWQGPQKPSGHAASTGLGLAFCKLAVEAHGGEIDVQSQQGKGSTFTITLPDAEIIPEAHEQEVKKIVSNLELPSLTQAEKDMLQKKLLELQALKVYQVTRLDNILEQLNTSTAIEAWKIRITEVMYNGDQETFSRILQDLQDQISQMPRL
ncbi:MAG: tetratricopeptide repeat protein [Cyclobacteriaceae bacterium]|nr:tetratricopeptide repeat protein [Cyclobacteriaceae bacterium HetDA_MAG_MS6]